MAYDLSTRDKALTEVKRSGLLLEQVKDEWKNDFEIVLTAVTNDGHAFVYASQELQKNKEIALAAIEQYPKIFNKIPKELLIDKKFMLSAVKFKIDYRLVDSSLREDKDLALAFVSKKGAYNQLPDVMKNDKDVFIKSLVSYSQNYQYFPEHLKNDKGFILKALKKCPQCLSVLPETMKGDREIVREAVEKHCYVLKYASASILEDKQFILSIKNRISLLDLSEKLRDDKEVVMSLVDKSPYQIEYASKRLREDIDVFMVSVKNGDSFAIRRYENNYLFSLIYKYKAVKKGGLNHNFSENVVQCIENAQFNTEFYKEIYSNDFYAKHAFPTQICGSPLSKCIALRDDYLPDAKMIARCKYIDKSISQIYKERENEWLSRLEENKLTLNLSDSREEHKKLAVEDIFYFKNKNKFSKDIEFIDSVVSNIQMLERLPKPLLNNEELAAKLLNRMPEWVIHFSDKIKNNKEMMLNVLLKKPDLIQYLPYQLKEVSQEQDFLEKCLNTPIKKCWEYALSFKDFAYQYLENKPELVCYSVLCLDDLYERYGNKFLNSCFCSTEHSLILYAVTNPHFVIGDDTVEIYSNKIETPQFYYIKGMHKNIHKNN